MANDLVDMAEVGARATGPERVKSRGPAPCVLLNELFDYLQARPSLVLDFSPEMRRLLEEQDVGAVSDDFCVAALLRVLDLTAADQVHAWKSDAATRARALSSENKAPVWPRAIGRIFGAEAP